MEGNILSLVLLMLSLRHLHDPCVNLKHSCMVVTHRYTYGSVVPGEVKIRDTNLGTHEEYMKLQACMTSPGKMFYDTTLRMFNI